MNFSYHYYHQKAYLKEIAQYHSLISVALKLQEQFCSLVCPLFALWFTKKFAQIVAQLGTTSGNIAGCLLSVAITPNQPRAFFKFTFSLVYQQNCSRNAKWQLICTF